MFKNTHRWGYFPEYRQAIKDNNTALWPEEFSIEELSEERGSMGEVAWAQEMMNEPIPDHELFKREDFEACKDFNQLGKTVTFMPNDGHMTTYGGADLAIAKTKIANFVAITTAYVRDDKRIQLIDGYRGKPGSDRLVQIFRDRYGIMQWSAIQVENNNTQEFVIHTLEQSDIPVWSFNTGINKADIQIGIPRLAHLVKTRRLILPTGDYECEDYTNTLIGEALMMGEGHSGDVLMATWMCVNLIQKLNPTDFNTTSLPPDKFKVPVKVGYLGKSLPDIDNDILSKYNTDKDSSLMPNLDPRKLPMFGNF